jgi:hypothetical protein
MVKRWRNGKNDYRLTVENDVMAKLSSVVTEQWQNKSFDQSNGKIEFWVGHGGGNDKNPICYAYSKLVITPNI